MAVWQAGGPRCKGLNFVVGEGKFLRDSAQTVTPNELCPVVCGIYADCLSACSAVYVSIFPERAQDKICGVSVV